MVETRPLPRLVVAAMRGGAGKTTLTLGLIQALKARGLSVAPFKKGPDYIDPSWHAQAAGHPCRNLDPYLMGREQVLASFTHFGAGLDCALVEGNRGLFDGLDAAGSYSTAELAKWLAAPLLLAVDCSMTSRTVAAVVLGCQNFDPGLNLAGVVLNPVANARQEKVIRAAIADSSGIPVLGAVPRLALNLPQRHMGLVPPQEHAAVTAALAQAGEQVASCLDMEALWGLMTAALPLPLSGPPRGLYPPAPPSGPQVRIGVVRDAAFGFYYPENLEALENHGARLVFCSALSDRQLPEVDALYLGGGFPETHAGLLSENREFRDSLLKAARDGLPIYAECGGLMYLGREIAVGGRSWPMVGLFPITFAMQKKPQGHGYTSCRVVGENPFWPVGGEFRAHEFHYSSHQVLPGESLAFALAVNRGQALAGGREGALIGAALGTYHHVHVLGAPDWAAGLVRAAGTRAQVS